MRLMFDDIGPVTKMGVPNESEQALEDADYQAQADFRYALRRFLRGAEENARAAGVTPQQHLLLLAVRGHPAYPEVNITDLAERLQVRHHSASLLVDRAVNRKPLPLLRRQQDPVDRRRALVSLSPEGQRVLDEITSANRQELPTLERSLSRLRTSMARATHEHGRIFLS